MKFIEFTSLRSIFEKNTLKLTSRAKKLEVEKSKSMAFPIYLICLLRKSSIDLIFVGYKLLVNLKSSHEIIFPDSCEIIAKAFKELLIYQHHLIDRAFWEVQCRRVLSDKKQLLNMDTLNLERFSIMNKVVMGAFEAYKEFCELLIPNINPNDKEKFLGLHQNRMNEYAEMNSLIDSKEPKGTLLWEAGKKIANAMVGCPDIRIVTLIVQTGVVDIASARDFIAAFFKESIKDIKFDV